LCPPLEWKLARLAQPACERLCLAGALAWLAALLADAMRAVAAGAVDAPKQQKTHSASSDAQTAACSSWRRIGVRAGRAGAMQP
jgi:hypothetical protein